MAKKIVILNKDDYNTIIILINDLFVQLNEVQNKMEGHYILDNYEISEIKRRLEKIRDIISLEED